MKTRIQLSRTLDSKSLALVKGGGGVIVQVKALDDDGIGTSPSGIGTSPSGIGTSPSLPK